MALPFDDSNKTYNLFLECLELSFNIILIFEGCVKIYGLGVYSYSYSFWNKIDFIVLLTAVTDVFYCWILISEFNGNEIEFRILKGMRVIRVFRLMKLIQQKTGVEKLLYTLKISFPMVMNIIYLLLIIYFIFALLGCHFFGMLEKGEILDDYINFKNFSYSLMTIFKVATADDWNSIMVDVVNAKNDWWGFYFIIFYVLSSYILTNLFILVLLQQFENYNLNPHNPMHSFTEYLEKFRNVWSLFTAKHEKDILHETKLPKFLKTLREPMGIINYFKINFFLKGFRRILIFCK